MVGGLRTRSVTAVCSYGGVRRSDVPAKDPRLLSERSESLKMLLEVAGLSLVLRRFALGDAGLTCLFEARALGGHVVQSPRSSEIFQASVGAITKEE